MSTLSQFSGGGIKSIQRGALAASSSGATATIAAVNTAKTMLNFCGSASGRSSSYSLAAMIKIELISSTEVRATTINGTISPLPTVSYEVIEYF